jgi:hypothetical protein
MKVVAIGMTYGGNCAIPRDCCRYIPTTLVDPEIGYQDVPQPLD